MKYLVLILALALAALSITPAVAAADGVIAGQLVNGTANGSGVGGVKITLTSYFQEEQKGTTTTTADEVGKFGFQGLETGTGWTYLIALTYQGADYDQNWVAFTEGETTKQVEVKVWDATDDGSLVRVAAAHILLEVTEQGKLSVLEFYSFVNEGDKAYVGSKEIREDGAKETLRFALPAKASAPEIQEGLMECCIVTMSGGLSDTMAVMPGTKELMFQYEVPYGSAEYLFTREMLYPTDTYNLLVKGATYQAQSAQLSPAETLNFDGQTYLNLTGENLAQGAEVTASVTGLPSGGTLGVLRWAVPVGLGVLAMAGLVVVYPKLRRRATPVPVRAGASVSSREAILQEIADLDDRFEAGTIAEAEYRRLRAERKARLPQRGE